MKNLQKLIVPVVALFTLISCEHNVSMKTTVSENGELDKVIAFESKSVKDTTKNILGLRPSDKWSVTTSMQSHSKDTVYVTTWQRKFSSVTQANAELASPSDTLLRITSSFEKKFRWFYTYIDYSETYHAINTLDFPIDDYVTREDFSFIDRLPAEGKEISKADSLYLSRLNEKISDIYFMRGIYEEYYQGYVKLMIDSHVDGRWLDTLKAHKESIYRLAEKKDDVPDNFMLEVLDSLKIPLPYGELKSLKHSITRSTERKLDFFGSAGAGKYVNKIEMPWRVIDSNADSVSGNETFWKPPVIKFMIKDYRMFAESRKMNYWAVVLSILIVLATVIVFIRNAKR